MTAPPEARQAPFFATAPFEHAFYSSVALLLLVLVAAGFSPTFYARDVSVAGPLPSAALMHGLAGTAWVLLFAAQAPLIATRRVVWHRRAGWALGLVTVVFVVTGVLVTTALERSHGTEPLAWRAPHLFTNGAPLTLFVLLVAAGISQRSRAARHKRLMLLAAIVLSPPAIGRLFGQLGLTELNLVAYAALAFANACYDWLAYGRPHAVSLVGAAVLVATDAVTTVWLAAVGS